jgi:hypothetical protein
VTAVNSATKATTRCIQLWRRRRRGRAIGRFQPSRACARPGRRFDAGDGRRSKEREAPLGVSTGMEVAADAMERKSEVDTESRLGGVNRTNLKFTKFKHNYKPGLALKLKMSPRERTKTNHKQIKSVTR